GIIINPTSLYGLRNPDTRINANGAIVAPGLVDVQLNGAFGYDFSFNRENITECLDVISQGILQQGCTSFCPTVVSSMPETYHKILPHIGKRPGSLQNGAESLGAHVEGPFLNPEKKGAHEQACLQAAPNGFDDIESCFGAGNLSRFVAYMTIAAEVEGVLDCVAHLVRKCGVGISQGHSLATSKVACQAQANGANMITHLFNAMSGFHHRDPGIIGLLGADYSSISNTKYDSLSPQSDPRTHSAADVFYGLICDGIHVHPSVVKIAYASHPAGAILVTDAMGAMGLPDGQYKLGNVSVDVGPRLGLDETTRAAVVQGTNILAGSIVTLIECVRNFKKFTGCSVVEAIDAATLHPAQMLGISSRKGTLRYGADADIIFLDDDLYVQQVFIRGAKVYSVEGETTR
ncbi:N-acetyl-glucosamine-6-phosphate deacetylase, partial [Coemansia guatemalensis]